MQGWISPGRPLAVLGAGIAGITAALTAAGSGVRVTIFEKAKPAALQSRSFRWVDPVAYDWPHTWWGRGEIPLIEASEGRRVAFRFADRLKRQKGIRPVLHQVTGYERKDHGARVTTDQGFDGEFALALDCRGAGQERPCGDFKVIPFWSHQDPRKLVAAQARVLLVRARR